MRPEATDVKVGTLIALADALDWPVEDLLACRQSLAATPIPNEEALMAILAVAFDVDAKDPVEIEKLRTAADIVQHGLQLIEDDPGFEKSPSLLATAVRRSADRPTDRKSTRLNSSH